MATAEGPVPPPQPTVGVVEEGRSRPLLCTPDGDQRIRCPWAGWASPDNSQRAKEVSLQDIMSEQLANTLQVEEEDKFFVEKGAELLGVEAGAEGLAVIAQVAPVGNVDTSSDFMIAQMLQMQFSKEHDLDLRRVENKYNGASKISVSLNNYLMSPEGADSSSDDEYADLPPPKNWDKFEEAEKQFPQLGRCGYAKVNNTVLTKHDATMNGRRNAQKVMESLPPCIQTGDAGSFDMQLSNKVYNKLKAYSKQEENRRTRLHDKKEKSTSEMAIDPKTRLLLYKMINATLLSHVYGIISTGKEAVVLYAHGGTGEEMDIEEGESKPEIPAECAIKIFKTTLNEFKTRDKYIRDDFRFKDRFSKQNPRKVIHLWAEKEMHNLGRILKAGIPCPRIVQLKKHILVMSFIGEDMKPAPKLKEVKFSDDDEGRAMLNSAYSQTIDIMVRLFKQCNLVHADLSEYNILWWEDKCHIIDVSQSVEPTHPNALEFLYRDCANISTFFAKRGVKDCHSAESLFTEISGFTLDGSGNVEIINQIQDYEKNLEMLTFATEEKPFAFDYCWEKSHQQSDTSKSPPS